MFIYYYLFLLVFLICNLTGSFRSFLFFLIFKLRKIHPNKYVPVCPSLSSESLAYAEQREVSAETPADTPLESSASCIVTGDLLAGADNSSFVSASVSAMSKNKINEILPLEKKG